MGLVKRLWEEEQAKGYVSRDGKTVCYNCFEDYGIQQFIESKKSHDYCSYCNITEHDIIACELDLVIEHILESLSYEWGNPADEGLPYETREGGWQLASVYDTWELFEEVDLCTNSDKLYEDICNSIYDQEWCERNPYSLKTEETLKFGWEKFSYFVCNKARYVFF